MPEQRTMVRGANRTERMRYVCKGRWEYVCAYGCVECTSVCTCVCARVRAYECAHVDVLLLGMDMDVGIASNHALCGAVRCGAVGLFSLSLVS